MWTLFKSILILASMAGGMLIGAAVQGTDAPLTVVPTVTSTVTVLPTTTSTPVSELALPVLQ